MRISNIYSHQISQIWIKEGNHWLKIKMLNSYQRLKMINMHSCMMFYLMGIEVRLTEVDIRVKVENAKI